MFKTVKISCFSLLITLSSFFFSASIVSANPYKIVWQRCAPGSDQTMVIRCRLEGGEECFANWQGHCNEPPEIAD